MGHKSKFFYLSGQLISQLAFKLSPELKNKLRLLPSCSRFKLLINFIQGRIEFGSLVVFSVYFPTFSKRVLIISTGHLALVSQTLSLPFYPKIKEHWLFQPLICIGQYRCMWRFSVIFRKREAEAAVSFEFSTKYNWLCMQSYFISIKSWVVALGMRPAARFISKTPF